MNKHKFILAISGFAFIAVLWIYYASTNPSNEKSLVKFLSVEQLLAEKNSGRVRLGGLGANGSIELDGSNYLSCTFDLKEGEMVLPVHFLGVRPDLFKDGAEVVVEGEFADGQFQADILQTKCASRYEGDLRDADSYNLDEISI